MSCRASAARDLANLAGLRERPDRGCREQRQIQFGLLRVAPLRIGAGPPLHVRRDAGQPRRDRFAGAPARWPGATAPPRRWPRSCAAIAASPSSSPRARTATSCQSSARRRPASPSPPDRVVSSCARSTGTCSRLHDGATISLRVPRDAATCCNVRERGAQVRAPDIAPVHHAQRQPAVRPAARPAPRPTRPAPRTRSTCSPATGSPAAVPRLSPSGPK